VGTSGCVCGVNRRRLTYRAATDLAVGAASNYPIRSETTIGVRPAACPACRSYYERAYIKVQIEHLPLQHW